MPSHKIHISVAQKVNELLNLDIDDISLGSVLPDLALVEHHGISHFQYKDEYPYNLANAEEFIKYNKKYINNAISIGYIIHLLTDRYYNEKYFNKFYLFENGKPSKLLIDFKDNIERKKMKHHDFLEYDKYLVDTKCIIPFAKYVYDIPKYSNMNFNMDTISKYITKSNNQLNKHYGEYDFKYWKKEELDNLYDGCINYIINYLKESNFI